MDRPDFRGRAPPRSSSGRGRPGRGPRPGFVHPGRRICTVWADRTDDETDRKVNRALAEGDSRTLQQDVRSGIRQIVDIALHALSPGVNDPTTAHECIVHLGAVTYEILRRELPPQEKTGDGVRRVVLAGLTHADFVAQAFDEIRQSAASLSSLARVLVETLAGVAADLAEDGITDLSPGRAGCLWPA